MNYKTLLAVVSCAAIAGCAGIGRIGSLYAGQEKHVIDTTSGEFWVFDRPDLGSLVTVPGPAAAAAAGAVAGATLTLVNADPVLSLHREVARQWLAKSGRRCEIKASFEPLKPYYEHAYSCR